MRSPYLVPILYHILKDLSSVFYKFFEIFSRFFLVAVEGVPPQRSYIIPQKPKKVKRFLKNFFNFGKKYFQKSGQNRLTKILKCGIMVNFGPERPRSGRKNLR